MNKRTAKTTTGSIPKVRSFFRLSGRITIAMVMLVSAAAFAVGSSAASLSFISSIGELLGIPTSQISTGLATKPVEPNSANVEPTLLTNGGRFTSIGQTLTENFDGLADTGSGIAWIDDSTIPGAFASALTYRAGAGNEPNSAMYSFGSVGSSDRALGSTVGPFYYGFRLINNTGFDIGSLDISYVGEQWRAATTSAQGIEFQYQVAFTSGIITDADEPSTGWIDFDSLDFVSPNLTTVESLDGNLAANRRFRSAILSFPAPIAPGQEIWIRWVDVNHTDDPDHGLAIDDLSITALAKAFETSTTPGTANWIAPPGVTSVTVEVWGGGGGGGGDPNDENGGGGGGGGGAYARLDSYTVVPGNNYPYTIGAAGQGGSQNNPPTGNGANGGYSRFVGESTLNAAGGSGGEAANGGSHGAGGAGGAAGLTGNVKFSGGSGNTSNSTDTGGGGGGSAGTGNNGNSATSITGAAAVTGGGPGGNGGNGSNGNAPVVGPGGGGGGGGGIGFGRNGGPGSPGLIRISYILPPDIAPTVTSPTVSGIGATGATLGANVTSDGGAAITVRGTCWGIAPEPTGNCSTVTGATGVFTDPSAGTMPPGTLIYYRGYATNSVGRSYSSDGSFTTAAVLLVTGPTSVTFGTLGTIATSGGGGTGAVTHSVGSSTGCSISGGNILQVDDAAGTCNITATQASDANYLGQVSAPVNVTLNKAGSTTTINCSPGKFAYTGSPIEPCTATVTRVGSSNTTVSIAYANNVAIGVNTATANASYAEDNNHTGSTATEVTFSIEVPSLTFNSTANLPAGTYQDITVESSGVVTVTGDIEIAGCVRVEDGGTLLMGGFTFTGSGCFTVDAGGAIGIGSTDGISADGTNGNVRVAGAISYGTGGRYIYNGSGNQIVGSGLPSTVAGLEINNSGDPGTVTGKPGQVVTNTLSITDGVYVSSSDYHNVVIEAAGTLTLAADITVSGNWTNNGGTLVHDGQWGVTFDGGTGQTIAGDTTFYDFEKSGAGQTMFFTAGSTTTVENDLTLNGVDGSRLLLRSTLDDSEWNIDPNAISMDHVDVRDSNNTGTPITVSNSINQGNNTGWTFRLVITPHADQSKVFGAQDPILTYAKDITDLNVSITGALSYTGGSGIGLHAITIGNLAAAGYSLILNPQNFQITQGVDTPSVSNSGQTFTGSAFNITVACPSGLPATAITPASQTNISVYPVTASCPGNANYSATTNVSAGNFVISQAADTPSVSNSGQAYTGNPIPIPVTCLSGATATAISPVSRTNVGVYPVTASCPGNANYGATTGVSAGSFEIIPAATTTTITCPVSAVYTGSAIEPCTYTVSGPGLAISSLPVASGSYTNNLNFGVASATHNYAGGGNYAASSDVETFNITAAAPSCTVTGYNVSYDGNPHTTANGTCTGVLAANVPGTFNMSATTHSIPGTYNDPWTFTPSSANYSIVNGSVTNRISFCPVVSIPTAITSRGGGANVEIPINTANVTNGNLAAVQFTFNYSQSVLDPSPANISVAAGNILSPSSVITFNANDPGSISVSISNTQSQVFAGTGSIVKINMKVLGGIGSNSALTLTGLKWFTAGPPIAEVLNCGPSLPGSLSVVSGTISGTVRYSMDIDYPIPGPHATPTPNPTSVSKVVKDVAITATGPSPLPTPNQAITDSAGLYSMNGFGAGVYSISPFKTAQTCGLNTSGINSSDLTLISRRVVNLITFSADQEKAAQVSGLGFVNALDATLVARFLVCISNPGSRVGLWNFDPNGNSPVDNVNGGTYDFKALLMGDVSGDWNPAPPEVPVQLEQLSPMTAVRVSVPNMQAERNSGVTVPLRLDNLYGASVDSYQFEIQYDPAVIQPSQIAALLEGTASEGMNLVYNVPSPGSLLVVVYGVFPANGDGVYANLKFVTIGGVGSSSPLTISGFRFNDGKTEVVTSNGVLSVSVPSNPEINGRVLGPQGQAIRNAQVFLTAANGESFAVNSSSLGYFQFGGLTLGETYTISVRSRRYRFTPQTVSITDSLAIVDMIGLE